MRHASRATDGFGKVIIPNKPPICSDCQIGKMPTRSFPPSDKRTESPLVMVHCDLVEFPVESYYWHKYCLTVIDDYSGYGTICLLRTKSDTARAFSVWVTWAETQWSATLLQVHSNRGGEFMATIFCSFLTDKGVEHQLSIADHPQQNGRAKQFNRTLLEKEETMHHAACLPKNLWNFALDTAVHVYNRTPMRHLQWKTPIELILKKKPDISYLRVFGCLAYVHIPKDQHKDKLTPKAEEMIFLGYESGTKGYCFLRSNKSIYVATTVTFVENLFPNCSEKKLRNKIGIPEPCHPTEDDNTNQLPPDNLELPPQDPPQQPDDGRDDEDGNERDSTKPQSPHQQTPKTEEVDDNNVQNPLGEPHFNIGRTSTPPRPYSLPPHNMPHERHFRMNPPQICIPPV